MEIVSAYQVLGVPRKTVWLHTGALTHKTQKSAAWIMKCARVLIENDQPLLSSTTSFAPSCWPVYFLLSRIRLRKQVPKEETATQVRNAAATQESRPVTVYSILRHSIACRNGTRLEENEKKSNHPYRFILKVLFESPIRRSYVTTQM